MNYSALDYDESTPTYLGGVLVKRTSVTTGKVPGWGVRFVFFISTWGKTRDSPMFRNVRRKGAPLAQNSLPDSVYDQG